MVKVRDSFAFGKSKGAREQGRKGAKDEWSNGGQKWEIGRKSKRREDPAMQRSH